MKLNERPGLVTMKGNPLVLLGDSPQVGNRAPEFKVVDNDFKAVNLCESKGKVRLITPVPSLDTQVCSLETQRFNQEAANLPADVLVMAISMDLPFAQQRFCKTEKINRVQVLSDHVWHEFGNRYGVIVKDMGLLARSIFVVDRNGILTYAKILSEMTLEPNYEEALEAVRAALENRNWRAA